MISHKYKIIEIHIPRTAGRSRWEQFRRTDPNLRFSTISHEPIVNVLRAGYWSYSFTRNPWARFWSVWSWIVGVYKEDFKHRFDHWLHKLTRSDHLHSRSQWDYIAIDGQVVVDFLGRFENLRQDWAVVAKYAALSDRLDHTHKQTYTVDYREAYTCTGCQIVADLDGRIIDHVGYTFET